MASSIHQVEVEGESADIPLAEAAQEVDTADLAALYRRACHDSGCRVNTAVMRNIETYGPRRPLVALHLANNYVGPKGLVPIMELIAKCQTLETLDLTGNGITNDVLAKLTHVLNGHLGVSTLILDNNNISVDGAKHLIHLLEHNKKITKLSVAGTEIFASIQERLQMLVAQNLQRAAGVDPVLVPLKPPPAGAPSLITVVPSRDRVASADTRKGASAAVVRPTLRPASPVKDRAAPTGGEIERAKTAASVSAIRPKPPPPAVSSRDIGHASRLTDQQREEMRQRFKERSAMFAKVESSSASQAVSAARHELMLLEGASHAVVTNDDRATPPSPPTEAQIEHQVDGTDVSKEHPDVPEPPPRREAEQHSNTAPSKQRDSVAVDEFLSAKKRTPTVGALKRGEAHDSTPDADDGRTSAQPVVMRTQSTMAAVPLTLTKNEQFNTLFQVACKHYAEKNLDAAYLSWNECLEVAVNAKNREWIAVVSGNLQRLSYELLVTEGMRNLQLGRLEDADISFRHAQDLAAKSKNAEWEAEMQKCLKSVQLALFHRSYDAAVAMLDRASNITDKNLTTDDKFVEDGALVEHTTHFASEWPRLLIIKETVECLSDAMQTTRKLANNQIRKKQETVHQALNNIKDFLARKYFVIEAEDDRLTMQKTSQCTYDESQRLISLWTDMHSKSHSSIGNESWDALCCSMLGNLYFATHQLPQAVNFFERMVSCAAVVGDEAMSAVGCTYLGVIHWHRADFSLGERSLLQALELWQRLRNTSVERTLAPASSPPGDGSNNSLTTPRYPTTPTNLSAAYASHMQDKCYRFLIRILAECHRYRDALEMLERGHIFGYKDQLNQKIVRNFTSAPTIAHMQAVALSLNSPLVYYELSSRFEWVVDQKEYSVSELLYMWVVPPAGELKFVAVEATKEQRRLEAAISSQPSSSTRGDESGFASQETSSTSIMLGGQERHGRGGTIQRLIERFRSACHVEHLSSQRTSNFTSELPENAWRPPLQQLYQLLLKPIEDLLSCLNGGKDHSLITIVPSGILWLVPFHALIQPGGRYLVEDMAVQLSFSAIHASFAALNASRVTQRNPQKRLVAVQPETDASTRLLFTTSFPFDSVRSLKEGERVVAALVASQTAKKKSQASPVVESSGASDALTTQISGNGKSVIVADDMVALRENLGQARLVHVSSTTVGTVDNDDGTAGGICATVAHDDVGLLRSSDLSRMEIFAECVTMTNTNMSPTRVVGTSDGVLCLIRSFFAAGAACVIAGQWCTPDMMPYELFELFYHELRNQKICKAVALALGIRRMLVEDQNRFAPRKWAGYYAVGV